VVSGIGGHAHWMTVHADLYEEKTGTQLYPGSLNVVLERPWHVTGDPLRRRKGRRSAMKVVQAPIA
jgi:CTP-dependent riboflavin kinase